VIEGHGDVSGVFRAWTIRSGPGFAGSSRRSLAAGVAHPRVEELSVDEVAAVLELPASVVRKRAH